jgi:hypothetical protein
MANHCTKFFPRLNFVVNKHPTQAPSIRPRHSHSPCKASALRTMGCHAHEPPHSCQNFAIGRKRRTWYRHLLCYRMGVIRRYNIASVATSTRRTRSRDQSLPIDDNGRAKTERQDVLRRFTSTPHATVSRLMQRTVRVETNNKAVLTLALKFFERHQYRKMEQPEFLWRIVCESDPQVQSTGVPLSAFSDLGLRYVNIGQRGFLAVDLDRREAIGRVSDLFLDGEPRLRHRPPLDILFCMTAASLGLTALSGGCVGVGDRGVMIFGPPNSGKTTACYLAAKLGLEFHADQVVFLDMDGNLLRAWGDPFPAVFRPETLDFLREIRPFARRSTYADLALYYFDKAPLQSRRARSFMSVCSLFLDRGAASKPQLREITRQEAALRLRDYMFFNKDTRFDAQITAALTALADKPVYSLQYGSNPKMAGTFIEKMLR